MGRLKNIFTTEYGEKLTILKKILKLDEKVNSYEEGIENAVANSQAAMDIASESDDNSTQALSNSITAVDNSTVARNTASSALTNANTAVTTANEAKEIAENALDTIGDYVVPKIRKLLTSKEESGILSFNTTAFPSYGNVYDIVLVGGGGGGGYTLGSHGAGGGEVKELTAQVLTGVYIFSVGAGGTITSGANGGDGGDTFVYKKGYEAFATAAGGKGASYLTTAFLGLAGGPGGEDGTPANTTLGYYGKGGDTKYGKGGIYAKDNDGEYIYRTPSIGGGGVYLYPGAAGAVYIYGYVDPEEE